MLWGTWADLFIRSSLMIVAAVGVRKLLHRSSAAQRHQILLLALVFLAALPFLSALLPPIHIPVWSPSGDRAIVTVQSVILGAASRGQAPSHTLPWPLLLWLGGALAGLGFVVLGPLAALRVLRRAQPLRNAEWLTLLSELSSAVGLQQTPTLLAIDAPVMPLVFGLFRPRILLPLSCLEWPENRRRAVLLHELAHVRRRDLAAVLFANCLSALWWFQPLVWTVRQGLRRESEKACDALVIAAGIRPSDYAAELIAIAHDFKSGRLRPIGGIAMASPRDLEGRVLEILDSPSGLAQRTRPLAAVALLTAAAFTTSAVTLSSANRFQHSGEHT